MDLDGNVDAIKSIAAYALAIWARGLFVPLFRPFA
jgi:hypothetical protein